MPGLACAPQGATVEGASQGSTVRVAYSTQYVCGARSGRAGRKSGEVSFREKVSGGQGRVGQGGVSTPGGTLWTLAGPAALGPGGWLRPPGRGPCLTAPVAWDLDLLNKGMSSLGLPGTSTLSHIRVSQDCGPASPKRV